MVEGDFGTLSLLDCTMSAEARKSAFPLLVLEPESQQTVSRAKVRGQTISVVVIVARSGCLSHPP